MAATEDPTRLDGAEGRRPTPVMTTLERAFALARSGEVSKISEIVESLRRDRYDTRQLEGPALRRQLTNLIKAARAERHAARAGGQRPSILEAGLKARNTRLGERSTARNAECGNWELIEATVT